MKIWIYKALFIQKGKQKQNKFSLGNNFSDTKF